MKSTRRSLVFLGVLMMLAAVVTRAAFAHHSQSQFEPVTTISIVGTLTKASWSNPHTLFFLQAIRIGGSEAAQEWSVEGPSPRQLEGKGWGKDVSKVGDKLIFEGRPRRDGKPELLLISVTLADGKTISFKPE
jgi:hypothetical protein